MSESKPYRIKVGDNEIVIKQSENQFTLGMIIRDKENVKIKKTDEGIAIAMKLSMSYALSLSANLLNMYNRYRRSLRSKSKKEKVSVDELADIFETESKTEKKKEESKGESIADLME